MWATPCRWVVPSASAATAATTGVSSLAADRSRSIPCRWSVPRTVRPLLVEARPRRRTGSGCRGSRRRAASVDPGQCGTVTAPPVIAAAARNSAAFDRSGSIVSSSGAIGPGATTQRSGSESSIRTCRSRSMATVISMCGREGSGGPAWRRSRPPGSRAATISRALTNWLDAEASSVTRRPEPSTAQAHGCAATVKGRVPPSASTAAPELAAARPAADPSAGRTPARRRRSAPGPSASRARAGRKRITVPASPQSTVTSAGEAGRGSDLPLVAGLGDLHPERPQAVPHQPGVARVQPVADDRRPAGQRGQHQRPVGLRTWSRERAPWRGSAPGRAVRPRAGATAARAQRVSSPRARCSWPACRPCGPPWPAPPLPSLLPWRARRPSFCSSLARTAASFCSSLARAAARALACWARSAASFFAALNCLGASFLACLAAFSAARRVSSACWPPPSGPWRTAWRPACGPCAVDVDDRADQGRAGGQRASRPGRCPRRSARSALLASLSEALPVLLAIALPPFCGPPGQTGLALGVPRGQQHATEQADVLQELVLVLGPLGRSRCGSRTGAWRWCSAPASRPAAARPTGGPCRWRERARRRPGWLRSRGPGSGRPPGGSRRPAGGRTP